MAQFIPFSPDVEVNGETILSVVNGVHDLFKPKMHDILVKNNIPNPQKGKWYKQSDWLNAFKEISDTIGNNTLFSIGKAIPENANFPSDIDSIKKALESIDIAYHQNHRGGDIGYYKLVEFDNTNRQAVMECKNPYPCFFDKGIITAITRKFAPSDSIDTKVEIDQSNQPNRLNGGDSSLYIIKW